MLLVGSIGLPAGAAPKYPSKKEVDKAKHAAESSAGSAAAMKKKLAAAQATLAKLDDQAETAVEAYNGALVRLAAAKKAYTQARQRAADSAQSVEQARKRIGNVASTAYAGGGVAQYVTMFAGKDPQSVLDSAGTITALGQQTSGELDKLKAAKVVQNVLRRQAASALSAQRKETARVAAAKKVAEQKVAAQQKVIGSVAALASKLAKQADADAAQASSLAEKRRRGIAAAKAEAARKAALAAKKAAEAAAAAAHHHNGGGGGHHYNPPSFGHGVNGVIRFARAQLGKWYLWAADGPDRYDCSGLTMRAWQQAGVSLPHWSVGQWYATRRVSLGNLRRGDLVFYANNTSNPNSIHHVALYIGGGRMIEAPHTGAQVRISSIWRPGLIGAGRP
ncbi:MAG TPA: NlpC/P60 family protein [Streptosporangiales bacterium]